MRDLAIRLYHKLDRTISKLGHLYNNRLTVKEWEKLGKPFPPPHIVKQQVVKDYAKRYNSSIFIETGTYLGEMVFSMINNFEQIFSIELSFELFENAKKRFSQEKHVTILQGDSGQVLEVLLTKINKPCLFWLDGHYSEGITAKGDLDTPISKELAHIFNHPFSHKHIILIDDARLFNGTNDYPTLQDVAQQANLFGFNNVEVKDDIIRILIDDIDRPN